MGRVALCRRRTATATKQPFLTMTGTAMEPSVTQKVTNGPPGNPPEVASHSYESADSGSPQGNHGAIGHSEVTNGLDEGQEYLARRARVETLVMKHRTYYERSFNRRGLLGAVEFFSRSAENEQDLIRQVNILDGGGDPRQTGTAARLRATLPSHKHGGTPTAMRLAIAPTAAVRSQRSGARNTALTARNAGGGRVRLDDQR